MTTDIKQRKRSGISADRAYKLQRRLIARVNDIYSNTLYLKKTHEYILERMKNEVWESPELKKCPTHVSAYVSGYCEAIRANMLKNEFTWMRCLDGRLVSSKEVDIITAQEQSDNGLSLSMGYKSPWQRIDSDHSCHVYKGTLLPFDEAHRAYWKEKSEKVSDKELVSALNDAAWERNQV